MTQHEQYIHRCIVLARLGEYYVAPNPMVGAVLVKEGQILAEGWHQRYGGPHAEVNCFRQAEERGITDFQGTTLYVSLEPCSHYGKTPPCAKLIIEKHPSHVVVGSLDPNPQVAGRGIAMLREAGIDVTVGVLEEECRALNKRFLCLHEKHRPYIILKWAQTADGFIDRKREVGDGQEVLVISTPLTKQLVHKMRAENMAIMVGTRTALLDNPGLKTTRWPGRNPIRILLDRHGVVPRENKIFSPDAETIVYSENTEWEYLLNDLAEQHIHSLIVEGGATLLNYILGTGLYDEVHVEVSPLTIGEGVAAPKIPLQGSPTLIDGNQIYAWCH